jgi:hypothetical protein
MVGGEELFLLNVYNNEKDTVVNRLIRDIALLPQILYMAGDFNCHSRIWDPRVTSHGGNAAHLMQLVSDLELDWAPPTNHGPTHIPHNTNLNPSIIDLVFVASGFVAD